MPAAIAKRINRVIAEQFAVNENDVLSEWLLVDDLGADSYALVELLVRLEEVFESEMRDAPAEEIRTVGDVIRYVGEQLAGKLEQLKPPASSQTQ